MAKQHNIGLYLGKYDVEVAVWLNTLVKHDICYTKWVTGLIVAQALNKKLNIGSISQEAISAATDFVIESPQSEVVNQPRPGNAPILFGSGNTQAANKLQKDKGRKHGWGVRDKNGSFTRGTVINISISNPSVRMILFDLQHNGHQLGTYVKSLIKANIAVAGKEVLPRNRELLEVLSLYNIKMASVSVRGMDTASRPQQAKAEKRPAGKGRGAAEPDGGREGEATKKLAPPEKGVEPTLKKAQNPLLSFME